MNNEIKRETILEQELKIIAEMNDFTDLKKRIQDAKKQHNEEVATNDGETDE